ncbi:MAG: hypothetical protein U0L05_01100 [Schaedlerella sp.]|nr:hypothetical protein [Schaedlerella sp.]
MKHKTFVTVTLTGIILILLIVSVVVYTVDPYQLYHSPKHSLAYKMETNSFSYYNPGIAKNYDYDTVVTGSSMSRSFLPSYIDEIFSCKTVKLSMAEARGKDFFDLFEVLFAEKKCKRIIMGLDIFAFNVNKDFTSYEKPMYMYDQNIFNDLYYLTNLDGLKESIQVIQYTKSGGETTTMDEYQNYALESTFSKEKVIKVYQENMPVEKTNEYDKEELRKTIVDNLNQNLIPAIENNKECEFMFYFPPYSIARWGMTKNVEADLEAIRIIVEQLVEYPNVSIFFFQGEEETITDLNHYMDTIHFDSEVSKDIIDYMAEEKNKMTIDNYQQMIDDFSAFIYNYNYDAF